MMLKRISLLNCLQLKSFSRLISFKALNYEIRYDDPNVQKAEKNSKLIEKVLKDLSRFIKAGGGPKGIHRHVVKNKKLLVRDRLKLLFDSHSPFLEIGLFAGLFMDYGNIPAASTVIGIGKIHGQFCIVGANDATVKGGTFFPVTVTKQIRMQQLAYLNKLPCIYLVDSGGAFLPLQADIFPDRDHGGRTFYNEAVMSSIGIPQIAVVCGSSTAGGAYCPTMAEEAVIVKQSGVIFLGGPPLVKAATGETVSEQDLGGAMMHCSISGCTDYYAESEEEAFEMCRESVLTLNSPVYSKPNSYEEPLYSQKDLLLISGKDKLYKEDMYIILSRILDGSMFKEFKAKFGTNLITGFGYIHGMLVGMLANCNALTFQDAQKGAHFIQICDKRNIPLCFLQNSGEFEDAINDSTNDTLNCRAKMVTAHSCSKIPKITLCINGCYEDDNFTMCGWPFQPNFFLSWPLTNISSKKAESKMKSISKLSKLMDAKDIDDYDLLFESNTSAFSRASCMLCDGIISPENTRQVIALCLEIALSRNRP
ncbi:putative methylcrotonoyl-CoA carboxylase beta chain, mitochondrial [Araneus ventricosus]|uniref:methylcrotonoyl-CoA carboxylase n=1 Tax=Araneus ventricosus TaxID=182803 RepID=A0A4Y2N508_ARAVE|nr:putative methylcrotonoyl-CoA carboxylase beta chain, mitochondrial [Araneus ventricosus]